MTVLPTETINAAALEAIVASSFDPRFGEGWSATQLAGTLALPGSWARVAAGSAGFSLCRMAASEAELLLVAVLPLCRGRGIGAMLVQTAKIDAINRGAETMFLEVRDGNLAARQLYERAGFVAVGRRRDYYRGTGIERFDALTMRFDLKSVLG